MAEVRISDLTALAKASIDTTADLVEIVDTSATLNKKVTPSDLVNRVFEVTPLPIASGGTGNTTGTATSVADASITNVKLASTAIFGGTFAAGTANAIPYLNGSKVLTSGGVLGFDGSNLTTTALTTTAGITSGAAMNPSFASTAVYSATDNTTFNVGLKLTNSATPTTGYNDFIWFRPTSGGVSTYFGVVQNAAGAGDFVWNGYTGTAYNEYLRIAGDTKHITPGADNTQNFGSGSLRWATIYAGTGTINTSDGREKTAVRSLTAAEINAAKALAAEIGSYQFLTAIQAKGDAARQHIGMTVQRAIEVMQGSGLDPFGYGFICHDTWEDELTDVAAADGALSRTITRQVTVKVQREKREVQVMDGQPVLKISMEEVDEPVTDLLPVLDEAGNPVMEDVPAVLDEAGNEVTPASQRPLLHPVPRMEAVEERYSRVLTRPAGDRYSFRPDELLLFMARGFEARLSALEAT